MSLDVVRDELPEIVRALALAGRTPQLREALFEALRLAELRADHPSTFRRLVRWPLVRSLLAGETAHQVELANGLTVEVRPDSRIEQALLLSPLSRPDHVWEPQTSKLLVNLAADAKHVIVGGAYIGDHVLLLGHALANQSPPGAVHAFEPMPRAFRQLTRNLDLNRLTNVVAHQAALWDQIDTPLSLEGPAALASTTAVSPESAPPAEVVPAITIDAYVAAGQLEGVGLIMLDTEGSEERALRGARTLLARTGQEAPHVVFEVHRNHVDWSDGLASTSIVKLLAANGYLVFAIRDFQDNYPMANRVIEVVPIARVYLDGPPHGFNLLATKDADLVRRPWFRVVEGVSPKLLPDRDPALHWPLDG